MAVKHLKRRPKKAEPIVLPAEASRLETALTGTALLLSLLIWGGLMFVEPDRSDYISDVKWVVFLLILTLTKTPIKSLLTKMLTHR